MQVSETKEYLLRHMYRYVRQIKACPDFPHATPCGRCRGLYIGLFWWQRRLFQHPS